MMGVVLTKEKFQKATKFQWLYFYSKRGNIYLREKQKTEKEMKQILEMQSWHLCRDSVLVVLSQEEAIITEVVFHIF